MDIDRTAPVIVELHTTIAAPLEKVWNLHTNINAWPSWNSDIVKAQLHSDLAVGTVFEWETHGLSVASTIYQLQPHVEIAWGGPAHGIEGIHVWTFEPVDGGVMVNTRESWAGAPIDADPHGMYAALESSLQNWLAALKETAE